MRLLWADYGGYHLEQIIEAAELAINSRSNVFAHQRALDIKRLVESGVLCRSKFARIFNSVSIKSGEVCEINCKSWRCVKHREKWGRKWGMIIGERIKDMKIDLLVNLTTSEMIEHDVIFKALRRFMYRFRVHFGSTEYLKVVEYNKKHTQPHFHLLVCCPSLGLGTMPEKYRTKEGKNKSWPFNVYAWVKTAWDEALQYYAPGSKRVTQVWCQPPASGAASASYAVGYVTGQSKDEEPDATWKGRKLTYSKKFFEKPASEIWIEILTQLFGERDPEDKFFWVPNDSERIIGESPFDFANCAIMKTRFFEAQYFSSHGFFPLLDEPDIFDPDYYDIMTNGQECFNSV